MLKITDDTSNTFTDYMEKGGLEIKKPEFGKAKNKNQSLKLSSPLSFESPVDNKSLPELKPLASMTDDEIETLSEGVDGPPLTPEQEAELSRIDIEVEKVLDCTVYPPNSDKMRGLIGVVPDNEFKMIFDNSNGDEIFLVQAKLEYNQNPDGTITTSIHLPSQEVIVKFLSKMKNKEVVQ